MRPLRRGLKAPAGGRGSGSEGVSPLLNSVKSTSSSTGTPPEPEPSVTGNQLQYVQHNNRGWKNKLKTLFKKKDSSRKDKDKHHNKKVKEEPPILLTPTSVTTSLTNTTTPTPSRPQSPIRKRLDYSTPAPIYSPEITTAVSFSEAPRETDTEAATALTIKRSRSDPNARPGRLGAEPMELHAEKELKSVLKQTPTSQASSTHITKKTSTENSLASNDNSVVHTAQQVPKSEPQTQTQPYSALFACGPSLLQVAAACFEDSFPDPEMPVLSESSVSSTSAEADAVQRESSAERRKRMMQEAENNSDDDQGMELIFFQEDEEDWSAFPWSQRQVQTERVDKDIFLSFADMGFDDKPSAPPPVAAAAASAALKQVQSFQAATPPRNPVNFGRATTAPAPSSTNLSGPFPLSRTNPMPTPSPTRSAVHESVSSDQVVDRSMPATEAPKKDRPSSNHLVDRVSSIMKSVPNVFNQLTQAGPSSDAQILLTRSSSQVTWVSHADDFAALDARPLAEIVIPSSPGNMDEPPVVNPAVKAIRNAIFDSIENAESEQKEGEEDDMNAPIPPRNPSSESPQQPPKHAPGQLVTSEQGPILTSASSLTMDSRFVPPLSSVPVRQPSDGEDPPDDDNVTPPPKLGRFPSGSSAPMLPPGDDDDMSDLDDDLFLEESPPGPTFQPQPDTPGERRSLTMPSRSATMSASTIDDDESIGLNALNSPGRRKIAVKELYQEPSDPKTRFRAPTPPRKREDNDFGLEKMISSSWDFSGPGKNMPAPALTLSDDDSDSSSENIDHLLLHQRQHVLPHSIPESYEEASHSSFLDNDRARTFSGEGPDFESVVDTEIDEATGLFSCACWDIPPMIEQRRHAGLWSNRKNRKKEAGSLLEHRLRSDDDEDARKKGLGRKLIRLARSTSNSFKSIWTRNSNAEF